MEAATELAVSLKNNSLSTPAQPIQITALIQNDQGITLQTLTDIIDALDVSTTIQHIFTDTYLVPNDSIYSIIVYINSQDDYPENDTLKESRRTDYVPPIGVKDLNSVKVTLEQNIPNPAENTTSIPYSIPEAGEVIFRVHSMNGQTIYTQTLQSESGKQLIELNISNFSSGIYLYSIEYKGQKLVRQMNVF